MSFTLKRIDGTVVKVFATEADAKAWWDAIRRMARKAGRSDGPDYGYMLVETP